MCVCACLCLCLCLCVCSIWSQHVWRSSDCFPRAPSDLGSISNGSKETNAQVAEAAAGPQEYFAHSAAEAPSAAQRLPALENCSGVQPRQQAKRGSFSQKQTNKKSAQTANCVGQYRVIEGIQPLSNQEPYGMANTRPTSRMTLPPRVRARRGPLGLRPHSSDWACKNYEKIPQPLPYNTDLPARGVPSFVAKGHNC